MHSEISLLILGGFLGAGKTTVATNLVKYLWDLDKQAAYITNDQSTGLVDTEIAAAGGISVKEIAGGCFCCSCNEFAFVLDEIAVLREAEIIIAEAVGSCTDLVATVVEPLRIDLQRPYRVMPMTVVVDPSRAEEVFLRQNADESGVLHDDVEYIFLKQLEEAQVILINKADTITPERLKPIRDSMTLRFPQAHIMEFSAQDPENIKHLWGYLQTAEVHHRPIQSIDYERYANGEACLGWLNAECEIQDGNGVSMDELSMAVGNEVRSRQVTGGIEIAHLKVSAINAPGKGTNGTTAAFSVVQCVSSSEPLNFVRSSPELISQGRLLINLRAQATPELLQDDVQKAVNSIAKQRNLTIAFVCLRAFAPGAPNPPYQRR